MLCVAYSNARGADSNAPTQIQMLPEQKQKRDRRFRKHHGRYSQAPLVLSGGRNRSLEALAGYSDNLRVASNNTADAIGTTGEHLRLPAGAFESAPQAF
jgi:hypothetical protein